MSELRKFSRTVVSLGVVIEGPDGVRTRGLATDLSIGGMFVGLAAQYPFGALVTVEVQTDPPMRLPGTVRWNKPEGLGIQFGLIGVRETSAIMTIVKAAILGPAAKLQSLRTPIFSRRATASSLSSSIYEGRSALRSLWAPLSLRSRRPRLTVISPQALSVGVARVGARLGSARLGRGDGIERRA